MFGRVRTGVVPVSALFAALALCLWLAGCSGGSGGAGADGGCRGGKPFSTVSPAYKGAGPHRMIGFQLGSHDSQKWDAPDAPELPGTWAADRSTTPQVFAVAPGEDDYRRAQLAVCMSGPTVTGRKVHTCSYSVSSLDEVGTAYDMVSAYYDFTVFEARTGRLVKSFRIHGGEGNWDCPSAIRSGARGVAQTFGDDALESRLRGLVEGPAVSR
ncbi:hypothetical protein [Actinacidiphila bryophytorum]|uniref:Lipoprotein n=1 Tax=Actinacidiphila bryophytorum TaxID=1436133 RepID=A0A9W4H2G9_9ACTN|nr:hypothetical protein [Actinacidiphila bryophytorum]MBM9440343.1 hypothetical protein [Actinacidiphila bryophytorum]MBN6543408.1 hypothetical protein [Actinacidiphila bryophytorum]CAG7645489.1 conserved exported hypothetical protein [Actinacidiphila bryophytorum]